MKKNLNTTTANVKECDLPTPMTEEEVHDCYLNAASKAALRLAMDIANSQAANGNRDNRDLLAMTRLFNLAADLLEEKETK